MPLDLLPGDARDFAAFAVTRPGWGPGLDPSFGESFGSAFAAAQTTIRGFRIGAARAGVIQGWLDQLEQTTGNAPPNPENSQNPGERARLYLEMQKRFDTLNATRPDLNFPAPPSADQAQQVALDQEAKIAAADARMQNRPQNFWSGAGSFLGNLTAFAVDPINLSAMALVPGTSAGIVASALKNAAVAGVSQTAIEAASFGLNRTLDPNYGLGDAAANVLSAGAGGAVLSIGGNLIGRGLAKLWGRVNPGAMPRYVQDAGNVVTRDAVVADANPYRSAGIDGEMAYRANSLAAESAITAGKQLDLPVDEHTTGNWRPGTVFAPGLDTGVGVKYQVVEADSLVTSHNADMSPNPAYPAELQPRDRTRPVSAEQVTEIASKLEPARLGPSADASSGAPVVGPDNLVESGNARVLALRRAYAAGGDQEFRIGEVVTVKDDPYFAGTEIRITRVTRSSIEGSWMDNGTTRYLSLPKDRFSSDRAAAYREFLSKAGFDTGDMKAPVLIARRVSQLDPAERIAFTDAANRATSLRLSAVEQAVADARHIDGELLATLADKGLATGDNAPFVRGFLKKLPQAERGGLVDRQGNLSQEGVRRAEAALMARAYGDPALLGRALETSDVNVKAIAGALSDSAGRWAALRDAVAAGNVPAGMDITPDLLDAVRLVQKARDEGMKVGDLINQAEMFDQPTATTKALLGMMFRDEALTKATSRQGMARLLAGYAEEAAKNTTDARLFGDTLMPGDVLQTALKKAGREDLFAAAEVASDPKTLPEKLAAPEVGDATLHELDHLMTPTRPPILSNAEIEKLGGFTAQRIEGDWRLANTLKVVDDVERLAAAEKTAAETVKELGPKLNRLDELAKINGEDAQTAQASKLSLVRAVRNKLDIPSMDDTTAFAAWKAAQANRDVMIPDPTGLTDAEGNPVMRSAKEMIDQADAEIAAAKDIEACAAGAMPAAAA